MSVGTPVQPDYETMSGDPTAYKDAIEGSIMAGSRIGWAFVAHEQDTPNMTVRVDAGPVWASGTLTEKAAQNSATITAPVTNNRIDRVVKDAATGTISVITGVEAASPSAPAITAGKEPLCQVLLTPSTTAITNADITDERVGISSGLAIATDGEAQARTSEDVVVNPKQLQWGGAVILVETQTPSAQASVTFTGLSPTKNYVLKFKGLLSAQANIGIRFNADTGNNYEASSRANGTAETLLHAAAADQIRINVTTAYNSHVSGDIGFEAWSSDAHKVDLKVLRFSYLDAGGSGELFSGDAVGRYSGAADLTSITFLVSAGNFTGKVSLYEIND